MRQSGLPSPTHLSRAEKFYLCFERANQLLSLLYLVSEVNQDSVPGFDLVPCRVTQDMSSISKMCEASKNSVSFEEVNEAAEGQRIDNFLFKRLKGVPKSHVYLILRSGQVRVNKKRVDATYRLKIGDLLRIPPLRLPAADEKKPIPKGNLPILFEDEFLLALNKPAGVAVHGGSGVSFGVIEQLRAARPEAKFLELVHRLDRDTSGVLLLAKKRSALVEMHRQIREGEIEKDYLALVQGKWHNQKQDVKLPLKKYVTDAGERRVFVADDGMPSRTIFQRVKGWESCTLLSAALKTGRTHQIRVHLSHLGFPILGDEKYGDFSRNKELQREGLKRMFLHAAKLVFKHPASGEQVLVEAPLAPELQHYLHKLDENEAI